MSKRKPFKVGAQYVWFSATTSGQSDPTVYTVTEILQAADENTGGIAHVRLKYADVKIQGYLYHLHRDNFRRYREPKRLTLEEARKGATEALSALEDAVLRSVRDKLRERGADESATFVDPDNKHPDFGWDE